MTKERTRLRFVALFLILFAFSNSAAAFPAGLEYMTGKWVANTSFYQDDTWGQAIETRAVADGHLGGSFVKLAMTVPFPEAAFAFELYVSYDKFNKLYRLALLDDLNGYLDIYTGQITDGVLKVDNGGTGTAFPDGKGGLVVGVLEIKKIAQGGFELVAYTGADAAGELQPYMKMKFVPVKD